MNQPASSYYKTYSNATYCGNIYRFTSTGKERDEETGYNYHGARYYDAALLTSWLSVDPLADKYPGVSPYVYCANNPVKLVDPDGKEIDDYFDKYGNYLGSDNSKTKNIRIIDAVMFESLEKDGKGKVEHDEAYSNSESFSKASIYMSEEAQLKVYDHYNNTGHKTTAYPNEPSGSNAWGMTTVNGLKKGTKDDVELVGFYIRLNGNRNFRICDNSDEITNLFVHERNHIRRARSMGYRKWLELKRTNPKNIEKSAIESQRAHPSWKGCSDYFKEKVNDYESTF